MEDTKTKTAEIKFTVSLDEKNVPLKIIWNASDSKTKEDKECKSITIALWDPKEKNTYTIGLWTNQMMKDEMDIYLFQTLMVLADNHQKATGSKHTIEEMKKFCKQLAKKFKGENNGAN